MSFTYLPSLYQPKPARLVRQWLTLLTTCTYSMYLHHSMCTYLTVYRYIQHALTPLYMYLPYCLYVLTLLSMGTYPTVYGYIQRALTLIEPRPPTNTLSSSSRSISLRLSSKDSWAELSCTCPLAIRDLDLILWWLAATGLLTSWMEWSSSAKSIKRNIWQKNMIKDYERVNFVNIFVTYNVLILYLW